MLVGETVRGHLPPAWFWALPGVERMRALSRSQRGADPGARPAPRHSGVKHGKDLALGLGMQFAERGAHALKGLAGGCQLYALAD